MLAEVKLWSILETTQAGNCHYRVHLNSFKVIIHMTDTKLRDSNDGLFKNP